MPGIGDLAKDASELLNKDEKDAKKHVRVRTETVKAIFDAAISRVKKGEVVSIQGFGNLRVQDRKATKARNPQTGEQFDVPATKRLKFTASKTLKEDLNGQVHKKAAPKAAKPKAEKTPPVQAVK
jgi:DNA-binding protein HU-beta